MTSSIKFTINDTEVTALAKDTILSAADKAGIEIPRLCYLEGYRPDGNCRACVVEIEGERVLAPSCCRQPTEGMKVKSTSERAEFSQRLVVELLASDVPSVDPSQSDDSELNALTKKFGLRNDRFPSREKVARDDSNHAISVNLNNCIQCGRCVRACREEQVHDVIGYSFRGSKSKITFDAEELMGDSTCVSCGECVQACPTTALLPAKKETDLCATKKVDSVCPYCGVGCLLTFNVSDKQVTSVTGRDGPSNLNRLCVKGRFGFDYISHRSRLTKPLIRLEGVKKISGLISERDIKKFFREASWDEALSKAAEGFNTILHKKDGNALAGLGSAKCSNEEAYLFQKLIRTGFQTNNVDHCTRLCHASSVAAMLEMVGNAGVSNQIEEVAETDVMLIIGARPTENHPVAATFMKNAINDGKKLILIDPYRSDLARHADYFLQFKPDTDVLLLNAMMNVIITENLFDEEFVSKRTTNFIELKNVVSSYTPDSVSLACGIEAAVIRETARLYACAERSMIFWGMGISQHVHGTDNARCLISLALLTGNLGRTGTGIHPLRGQNNVQGASDAGLIPMAYPDYQPVTDNEVQSKFEKLWASPLNSKIGLTVTEIIKSAETGKVAGLYVMGENPALSDPDLNHARKCLAELDHLVVQDIFFTETSSFADVILPASAFPEKTGTFTNTDRRVQLGRAAVPTPGDAKQDIDIIQELANRIGLQWSYNGARDVFSEMKKAMNSISGITWEQLERLGTITYPYTSDNPISQTVLFKEKFDLAGGLAKFSPANFSHAAELPDQEFPLVLITGRQLEHWHTGTMTRRSSVLNALEPFAVASLSPEDMSDAALKENDMVTLTSRRGTITARAKCDEGVLKGNIFMPFCYAEAAANLLTVSATDPVGKIPEFKHCAIRIEKPA